MNVRLILSVLLAASFASCAAATTVPLRPTPVPLSRASAQTIGRVSPNVIPPGYRCFPDIPTRPLDAPEIAYADACSVAGSSNAANLQRMAVALMLENGGTYQRYCTGTPLRYNAATGIGWIVSAAHCVVGGSKPAERLVRPQNITTFASSRDMAKIYQGTPALGIPPTELTAQIVAVYIPSRYCRVPAIVRATCQDLSEQNGDIAVVKVRTINGNTLATLPSVRLAPRDLSLTSNQFLLAFGYGHNTSRDPNSKVLYYIDYRYYANDAYRGQRGDAIILNGYFQRGRWYSIICGGDSGGGDFAWDGTHWNLVGAHSYGPEPCGVSSPRYAQAYDASADIRPFTRWIQRIFTQDRQPAGCAKLGPWYTCAANPRG